MLTNKEAEAVHYTVIRRDWHLRTLEKCKKKQKTRAAVECFLHFLCVLKLCQIVSNSQIVFSKLTPSLFQFERMQDLPENHFRVSGASWVNIINYY